MPYYPERRPDLSGDEQKRTMRTAEKRRRLLRLSLILVFGLMIGYGAVRLVPYLSDLAASRQTARELQQVYDGADPEPEPSDQAPAETASPSVTQAPAAETPLPADTAVPDLSAGILQPMQYPDNPGLKMSDRFKKLRKKGRYIVGWIRFDEVDEAVAQKDNQFFLNHDATGKKNSNGAIFLDSGIFLTTRPYTFILYGHNMKSGNMFGRLKKYKESAYFHKHRIITFDTLYEDGQYAVFAAMEMDTTPGTGRWYDLWSLATSSCAEREEAIRTLEKRSAVPNTLDVQAEDQLLLLVTCLDGDTERLVVAARRLREGETPENLTLRQNR